MSTWVGVCWSLPSAQPWGKGKAKASQPASHIPHNLRESEEGPHIAS